MALARGVLEGDWTVENERAERLLTLKERPARVNISIFMDRLCRSLLQHKDLKYK